jgi:surface antigen
MNKQEISTYAGTAIGAILGYGLGKGHSNKELAIAAGAIAGGLFGRSIGAKLDERDQMLSARTMQGTLETAPTGTEMAWSNPDSGNSGSTTATRTIFDASIGVPCREFTTTIVVGGKEEQGYGTACRQKDGSWMIVEPSTANLQVY